MLVALCQLSIMFEDKNNNRQKVAKFVKMAKEKGADVIFFPEMTLTGFTMRVAAMYNRGNEDVAFFQALAVEYRIGIGFGFIEKVDAEEEVLKETIFLGENHYGIVTMDGELLIDYVKIHSFLLGEEDKHYRHGTEIVANELNGRTVAPLICFDLRFPEVFQAASRLADLIVVPANWPAVRDMHWKVLLRARAIENQCYLLGVNCVGEQNGVIYSGDSCVVTPDGEVMALLAGEEGLVMADIPDDVLEYRERFPMK